MKALLVIQRWSETESLSPSSGRPHLDLWLNTLGYTHLSIQELEPGEPFDPGSVVADISLIMVQGQHHCCNMDSSRLRRSLLSNLSLSLGLDSEESDRLRVVGARPLLDAAKQPAGFAIKRQGRIVAYFEDSVWKLHTELSEAVQSFLSEGRSFRRIRFMDCWLLEGAGNTLELSDFMEEEEVFQSQLKYLPDGDIALLFPTVLGDEFRSRLKERLADILYTVIPQPLEERLGELLREKSVTVSTAESCTAGLVATRLAGIAGSSDYLMSGFVTYSGQAKKDSLGVAEKLLQEHGQVSPETALAMARGALEVSGSSMAVAVTGIAGPGGGSKEKPVGTVFLAVANKDGKILEYSAVYQGNRDRIRFQASQTALHLLRRLMLE